MERTLCYTIDNTHDGMKLERFLMGEHGFSRRTIRSLKQKPACVQRNGVHIRMVDPIFAGDRIAITLADTTATTTPSDMQVPIVYEDDDLIIYNKPPFLATHPSKLHQVDTLANVYAAHMGENAVFRPVYRLDRDTDGLCVCAKNTHAAAVLAGKIEKTYTALVCGTVGQDEGTVDAPIVQLVPHQMKRGVRADGQRAVTHYRVKARSKHYTLLELSLETGRTHQIRVHMAYIDHPLAGDTMYGTGGEPGRQALTCSRVHFIHPISGKPVTFCIEMNKTWRILMQNE